MQRSGALQAQDAIVVAAKRTAVGKVGGGARDIEVEQLAAPVLRHLVESAGLPPDRIDNVILGNAVGPGGNVARLSLLCAGLPLEVPGYTVDMQCGSGLQAIHLAAQQIRCGASQAVLAGGVESSSRAPWKMEKPRNLYRGMPQLYHRARFAPDELGDPEMGIAAENVAEKYAISREAQDAFAVSSHEKAIAARQAGILSQEIVPLTAPDGSDFSVDEGPRADSSLDKLRRLPPVFQVDGTVTAGNACGINDGASAVLLLTPALAAACGYTTGLRFVDAAVVGVDPNVLGVGPIPAVRNVLDRCGLSVDDLDFIEFNEAFASQVLACVHALELPMDRLNVHGGAIALGHPYGASGAILVTRLFHDMLQTGGRFGLTTMGIGGGLGIAALWEWVRL